MRAIASVSNPDDIEFTMRLTMNLKKWKELREQLQDSCPSWELSMKISDIIHQAEESFFTVEE